MSRTVKSLSLCFVLVAAPPASAEPDNGSSVEVRVLDHDGEPVAHVAVYAELDGSAPRRAGPRPRAVMDQRDHRFVPHILVVETGTEVEFPNSDSVSHHVYSFSPIKKFELPLYKGRRYPPEAFDEAGLVTLGCNIHDDMLGYILVVDTPHFALTDARGVARLNGLAAGRYAVNAWTPRARPADVPSPVKIAVENGQEAAVGFRFTDRLYPAHDHGDSSLSWADY